MLTGGSPAVRGRTAFSLIEMLAVLGTTGLLAVLTLGAVHQATDSARKVREIHAARILVTALQTSAAENDGVFLPGMDYRVGTADNPVFKADGGKVTGHAAQRYPFRLAPYLGDEFDGTILVNRNKAEVAKAAGNSATAYDYQVSTFPALGMNVYGVGGIVRANGSSAYAADTVTRSANARSGLLAFASGGFGTGKAKKHGFNYVSPPTVSNESPIAAAWNDPSGWTAESDPMNYGWLDFRYGGKAVCAFLDGSVRLCGVEELHDMRLWSARARDVDDPDYVLQP
jgi:prepilin-type processing-associated H-X9-DG protein